ncbi:MAG: HAD family hydrolase [Prevotella sp.]|nr:HAD family hydrolase [Prevotella sp.]
MTYQTIVFDLDGTLLDTLDDLTASCNYALEAHGMPVHSRDEVRQFVGNGVRRLIERAVPAGTSAKQIEEVLSTFQQHYLLHGLDKTQPYEGIREMLAELKARGCQLAVVSNKFYKATQELIAHFFGDTINVAIGEHEAEGIRKKPAPDTVFEALRQLNVGKVGAVYVGDSDVDVETAKNCGIPCISVLWGFRNREFLIQHGATTLVESPEELLTRV